MTRRLINVAVGPLMLAFALCAQAEPASLEGVYLSHPEAMPALQAFPALVPAELGTNPKTRAQAWSGWVRQSDQAIRARLAQGDEDSLVNLLLFGTTFTEHPRVTRKKIEEINTQAQASGDPSAANKRISEIIRVRSDDFVKALAHPGADERLLFAQQMLVTRKGYQLDTIEGQAQVKQDLVLMVRSVLRLSQKYTELMQAAHLLGPPTAGDLAKLYKARGLSSDTSLRPNVAIEEALKSLQAGGLISNVKRVAIVGPGLDFVDKQEGYDFYPQQTIQPFAVADTLLRLGLSQATDLQITTLDLSPKVNAHIAQAKAAAQRGSSYTIQLPLETQEAWKPEFWRYWETFGSHIGESVPPVPLPATAAGLKLRAVKVRPEFAAMLTPTDVNIVLQRLELPASARFDLMIATNILVYYSAFEQSLALLNVRSMLQPGGVLLSNTALPDLPAARVQAIGSTSVVYSDRPGDGDVLLWYQRQP